MLFLPSSLLPVWQLPGIADRQRGLWWQFSPAAAAAAGKSTFCHFSFSFSSSVVKCHLIGQLLWQ